MQFLVGNEYWLFPPRETQEHLFITSSPFQTLLINLLKPADCLRGEKRAQEAKSIYFCSKAFSPPFFFSNNFINIYINIKERQKSHKPSWHSCLWTQTWTERNLNKKKISLLQNSNSGSQFLHWLEEETYVKQQFSRWETVWHSSVTFLFLAGQDNKVCFAFLSDHQKILLWWSCLTLCPKSMEASKGWNV